MNMRFLFYLCRRRRKESLTCSRFNFEPRHPGSCWVLSLLFALISAGNLFAADAATDFSTANKLYAEGKFADAANTYENILKTGAQSPALLFNDANAEFKAGNLGRAITAYRRAALLAPRDTEIRANLQFVRNQVQGPAVRKGALVPHCGTGSDS